MQQSSHQLFDLPLLQSGTGYDVSNPDGNTQKGGNVLLILREYPKLHQFIVLRHNPIQRPLRNSTGTAS